MRAKRAFEKCREIVDGETWISIVEYRERQVVVYSSINIMGGLCDCCHIGKDLRKVGKVHKYSLLWVYSDHMREDVMWEDGKWLWKSMKSLLKEIKDEASR